MKRTRETLDQVARVKCVICFEELNASQTLQCADGHSTCDECFEPYLLERTAVPGKTNLLASTAETAEVSNNIQLFETLNGCVHCPLRGHGCNAAPFDDRMVAMHTSADAFCRWASSQGKLWYADGGHLMLTH
jgi:hypothetical protein